MAALGSYPLTPSHTLPRARAAPLAEPPPDLQDFHQLPLSHSLGDMGGGARPGQAVFRWTWHFQDKCGLCDLTALSVS